MRALRLLLAASLFAVSLFARPASATSYFIDQSDLWYIPSESGWGIQLVQRGNIIFFTMFVYDPTGKPIWYVGTISPTANPVVWSGDVYLTSGSWFGAQPYNPALFGGRIVGTLTWAPSSVTAGALNYSVDGIAVAKNVVRQTLINDDYSGHYAGGLHEDLTNCNNPIANGTTEAAGLFDIIQSGTAINISVTSSFGGGLCTYSGTFGQDGQMGSINGTYTCNTRDFGTFTASEMQVNRTGFTGRVTETSTPLGCSGSGWFGGIRSTTF
jgi:hypothetical protein